MANAQIDVDFNHVANLLECSVCLEMLSGQVLLCKNGHNICAVHKSQLTTCPVCRDPYLGGPSRNLLAEAMVAIHRGTNNNGGHASHQRAGNSGAPPNPSQLYPDLDESLQESEEEEDAVDWEDVAAEAGNHGNAVPGGDPFNIQQTVQNAIRDAMGGFNIGNMMADMENDIMNAFGQHNYY